MLWMDEMKKAYPWLGTYRGDGVLATRHNQEDTPMPQDTPLGTERPDRSLPLLPLDEVVRHGAQRLLQEAVEVEVELFCERYQYLMDDQGHRQVVRNGHRPLRRIITGAGPIDVATPRVDDRVLVRQGEPRFTSQLVPPYLRRTKNIEELLPVLYLKGISTGDFTEALQAILGRDVIGLSAETIVRLKQVWQREYETWRSRDLSTSRYVYWWVDGIYFNVRLDTDRQCLLVIIGARPDGTKELVALDDGFRESADSWRSLLRELKQRGLTEGPAVATGDGALGFWVALAEEFPQTQPQLCWVHKTANVLEKLPSSVQGKAKALLHEIYLAPTRHEAEQAWERFIATFAEKYPKAVACLTAHRDALLTFYAYPADHWQSLRSTNVIESTFATVRLRTKRTKGCGSRLATLTMVFKLVESAAKRWHRLRGYRELAEVLNGSSYQDGVKVAAHPPALVGAQVAPPGLRAASQP
jgi:transposase-like protein